MQPKSLVLSGEQGMSQAKLRPEHNVNRRSFIGGSDTRIMMGSDEAALLRLWQEKQGDGYLRLRCFRKRTPSSSPFSPINSTPAASSACCNFARASSETRGPVPAS